nr:MAG TPA: hypothetical protein [Crassvirales sp.]
MEQKYIIGNLVYYKDKVNRILGVNTPVYNIGSYLYHISEKYNWNNEVLDKNITPIPLTAAILEKNGWEHKEELYWKKYPYFDLTIDTSSNELSIASIKDSIYLRHVEFVHQLQQGLFGLNLNSNINI